MSIATAEVQADQEAPAPETSSPAPPEQRGPSVWAAGDPHVTHETLQAEGAGGGVVDPKDQEIARLQAELATAKAVAQIDPKDEEIRRLRAQLEGVQMAPDAPVEATATTVDPRDEELAELRAQVEAAEAAPPAAATAPPGDATT